MSNAAHILIKEVDPDVPRDFIYRVECQIEGGCGGWSECSGPHEVAGWDADGPDDGDPFDCDPAAPWSNSDIFTFHGVEHTYRSGYGWTVPFVGCLLERFADFDAPDEVLELPPGRYVVDDEWDDTEVTLIYRGPEAALLDELEGLRERLLMRPGGDAPVSGEPLSASGDRGVPDGD